MKSSEDLLAIELVLFILESIAFSLEGSELAYCSEVLNSVLGRANEFN